MSKRGENSFKHMSKFGAKMYNRLMGLNPMKKMYVEIADILVDKLNKGRLLDIGTGNARLLIEIHNRNPNIELYGLDISKSMLDIAKKNLGDLTVNLYLGKIQSTIYLDDYFDLITCTGSFYLWDHPVEGLNEIFRILKPGSSAYLFESFKDHDKDEFKKGLDLNLKNKGRFSRKILPIFIKKQLKMTYNSWEVNNLIKQSNFRTDFKIHKKTMVNLPIWICIHLTKNL